MKQPFSITVLAILAAAAGCNAPPVERGRAAGEFQSTLARRTDALRIDPAKPLSVAECETIALRNNLDLRVRQLALRLQDDNVRIALSGFLPRGQAQYLSTRRSNQSLVDFGGTIIEMEPQNLQAVSVQATLPIFDFGTTYYGWRMAADRRKQETLLSARAAQTLRRDVRVAYARLAGAIRQEKLARIAVEAARQVLAVAKSMEREGLTARADTALVEAALARAGLEWSLAGRRVEEGKLALLSLLSLPPGMPLAVAEDAPPLPPLPAPEMVAAWEDHALLVRPELAVQDLTRHMAASAVRQSLAGFFPRVDGLGSFNWSDVATAVNPSYFTFGFDIAHSLLDGGATIFRHAQAKKNLTVQEEQALLLSMAVLYEVDFRALALFRANDAVLAGEAGVAAQKTALDRVVSLYKEGLETEANTVKALAELNVQSFNADMARTEYLVAWHELEATVLFDSPLPKDARNGLKTPSPVPFRPSPGLETFKNTIPRAPVEEKEPAPGPNHP
ncbi:MAG: TolC family protein [Planctomycetota bacterium]